MGKTWHFIFDTVDTLRQLYCYIKDTKIKHKINYSLSRAMKKKQKSKYYRVTSRKACFLYSHIARLHTFLFQDGQVS
jgi:hypothetical protein